MLTVVVQGQITQWTLGFVKRYQAFPFVKEVIVSTWEDEELPLGLVGEARIIFNKKPPFAGMANRNLQIVSSRAGCEIALTDWVLKVRSDLFLPKLDEMFSFAKSEQTSEWQIFVLSLYKDFAYHPRDWAFLGRHAAMNRLWDIPLDTVDKPYREPHNDVVRAEAYIGVHYYGQRRLLAKAEKYLWDISPERNNVLKEYHKAIAAKQYFVAWPQFPVEISKHYPFGYPFEQLKQQYGELYYEDTEEL